MRIVADTNTLISGLIWRGPPRQVLDAARCGKVQLISSDAMLAELTRVLHRPKFHPLILRAGLAADALISDVAHLSHMVAINPLSLPVCRDPNDDMVLATAMAGQASIIVSGDNDLLSLARFQDIDILTPAQALPRIA